MYSKAKAYSEQLTKEIGAIQKELRRLPKGVFRSYRVQGAYKWYTEDEGGRRVYIRKSQRPFAEKLAYRRYLEAKLSDAEMELKAIEKYLKAHCGTVSRASELLACDNGCRELIESVLGVNREEALAWMNAEYNSCELRIEERKYKSLDGKMYRSKSEAIIAGCLWSRNIAYRYECEFITCDGRIFWPDFMIKHPVTGEIYIWEHMGMMDKYKYRVHNLEKIYIYGRSDYIINDRLIVTMESDTKHMDITEIEEIVEKFFGTM